MQCVNGSPSQTSWTDQLDGPAKQSSWTDQLGGPAGQTCWTDQFFLIEAFYSSHIQRFSFQFVAASEYEEGFVWSIINQWFRGSEPPPVNPVESDTVSASFNIVENIKEEKKSV